MHHTIFRISLLWVCALAGTAPGTSIAQQTSPASALIGGQVLDAATGQPMNNVTLLLTAASGVSKPQRFVTETRGLFLFENLPPGRYVLFAEAVGYVRQVYGSRGNPLAGITLALADGQEMNDLQFNLIPGFSISGRVLDSAGNAVAQAAVLALQPIYQRGVKEYVPLVSAVSGPDGEYKLTSLSPGQYLLAATSRNGEGIPTFYPNSAAVSHAAVVGVDANVRADKKDIRLLKAPTFGVEGKVEQPNAAAAIAWLTPKTAGATALATRAAAPIGADGDFVFPHVAAGSYVLTATGPDGVEPASTPLTVAVIAKAVEGLVLKPPATGELSGAVSMAVVATPPGTVARQPAGAPLPKGMQVVLEAVDSLMPRPPRGAVNDDGNFTIQNIPVGRYIAHVQAPGALYVRAVRYRALDVTENGFEFGAGTPAPLLVSLSAGGAVVDGTVSGPDGHPMPGAVVALVPVLRRFSRYKETTTDQNGAFTLQGVAPGDYRIYAWDQIESGAYQNAEWLKKFELKGRPIAARQDGHDTVALKAITF